MNRKQYIDYLKTVRKENIRIRSELKEYGYTEDQIKDIDNHVNHVMGLSYIQRWFIAANNILNDLKSKSEKNQ